MRGIMKKLILFFIVLGVVFLSNVIVSHAYDATGIWNYDEHSLWDNCDAGNVAESGEFALLQIGSTILIVEKDDSSFYGNVSSLLPNKYPFSNKECDEGGVASLTASITLTSETTATGTVSWSWSGPAGSCSGGFQVTLSKQTQAAAAHDAIGRWTYNQSGFSDNCSSATTRRSSGYFDLTQTGNRITVVDNQGDQYSGFVNGAEYNVFRSYVSGAGRHTDWVVFTLSSGTQGNGTANFVWDDDCEDCSGSWNISITKFEDGDSDGIEDDEDNCPNVANPGQEDDDNDEIGNVCEKDASFLPSLFLLLLSD
jgi:hypothetical protein